MKCISILFAASCLLLLSSCEIADASESTNTKPAMDTPKLPLGAFSVSLAVKDLSASRAFYERLGFSKVHGEAAQNWLILQNGTTTIGLFQGMFEDNIMTFNPGWTHEQERIDGFTDVREIQRLLKKAEVALLSEADESTTGPASFTMKDPDGNVILFDQHVK